MKTKDAFIAEAGYLLRYITSITFYGHRILSNKNVTNKNEIIRKLTITVEYCRKRYIMFNVYATYVEPSILRIICYYLACGIAIDYVNLKKFMLLFMFLSYDTFLTLFNTIVINVAWKENLEINLQTLLRFTKFTLFFITAGNHKRQEEEYGYDDSSFKNIYK